MQETNIFNNYEFNLNFCRKILYQCKEFIDNSNKSFCILTGPRKTGKSYCLQQINLLYSEKRLVKYFNFKNIYKEEEQWDIIKSICNDTEDTIYLLDEITYIQDYDKALLHLAENYKKHLTKIKVIITGSQSLAISWCANVAFSIDAINIKTSFIDFEEWLLYRNKISCYNEEYNCTEEDYLDYVFNSHKFVDISDNKQYLISCINETINSGLKSYESIIRLTEIDEILENNVHSFLYSVLLSLHNRVNIQTFKKDFNSKLSNIYRFLNPENKQKYDEIFDQTLLEN